MPPGPRDPETKIRREELSRIRGRSAGKRWPGSVLAVHRAWTGADGCRDLPRPPPRRWRRSSRAPRILARAWFRRRVGSAVGSSKRPQELAAFRRVGGPGATFHAVSSPVLRVEVAGIAVAILGMAIDVDLRQHDTDTLVERAHELQGIHDKV